jgi:phage major head subunit gpT-like protein
MADKYTTIDNRGTTAIFKEAMAQAPNVWKDHCMEYNSSQADEEHVWVGAMAEPREFLSGRVLDTLGEYSLTLINQTFELSYLFSRTSVEDDKHGMLMARVKDMAAAWARFKDSLFGALLIAGETSTATFDGTAFHDTTRTIGLSAAINNAQTNAIVAAGTPTVAEYKLALSDALAVLWRYEDDKGVTAYNTDAMKDVRIVIPPEHHRVVTEVIESSFIATSENPYFKGLVGYKVLPYLTDADDAFYLSAVGSVRKGFVHQQRVPLEVVVLNDKASVADNDGVKILARERFRFGYGDPRRNMRFDFTTA